MHELVNVCNCFVNVDVRAYYLYCNWTLLEKKICLAHGVGKAILMIVCLYRGL